MSGYGTGLRWKLNTSVQSLCAIHQFKTSLRKWITLFLRSESRILSKSRQTGQPWIGKYLKYSRSKCRMMWGSRLSTSICAGCTYCTMHSDMDVNPLNGKSNTDALACIGCSMIALPVTKILWQQPDVTRPRISFASIAGLRMSACQKEDCCSGHMSKIHQNGKERWTTQSKSEVIWWGVDVMCWSTLQSESGDI